MRLYLEILRVPHVARLYAASLLARLPMGINSLAVILMVEAETGSFAIAGACSGALALGMGLGGPLAGRVIDALGVRVLLPLAVVHAATLIGLIVLARTDTPASLLVATSLVAGGAMPPASSVARVRYPVIFAGRPSLLQGAFALDTVLTELIFIAAPMVVALLAVLVEPAAALVLSAVVVLVGTAALVAAVPQTVRPEGSARPRGLGALATPGIRTLVIGMVPLGFAFGTLEVALPAFADEHGSPELAGLLLGMLSVGSVTGGLIYGARPRRRPLASVHLLIALSLPFALVPVVAAGSPLAMALLVLPSGFVIAPLIATRNELASRIAPVGAETEAFTWPLTAMVGGIAIGAAVAGAVVDAATWQHAVVAGIVAAAVGAALSAAMRGTLTRATTVCA